VVVRAPRAATRRPRTELMLNPTPRVSSLVQFCYQAVTNANRRLFQNVHACKSSTLAPAECVQFVALQGSVAMVCAEDIRADVLQTLPARDGGDDAVLSAAASSDAAAVSGDAAAGDPHTNDYMQTAKAKAKAKTVEDRMKAAFIETNFLSSYVDMLHAGLMSSLPALPTRPALPEAVRVTFLQTLGQFSMMSPLQARWLQDFALTATGGQTCGTLTTLYSLGILLLVRRPCTDSLVLLSHLDVHVPATAHVSAWLA
jgi:hypothetical protein